MKFLSKLVAIALVTSTYALAWNLEGTVNEITQKTDGNIGVVIKQVNGSIAAEKLVFSDDINKQTKMAMLLTAKTSGSTVVLDIQPGAQITTVTIK